MEKSKFVSLGAIALISSLSLNLAHANNHDACTHLGKVSHILEVNTPYYKVDVEKINLDGKIQTLKEKHVQSTDTQQINSFNSTYYNAEVKAKINDKIYELRAKSLKVNDTVEICKYNTVKIK